MTSLQLWQNLEVDVETYSEDIVVASVVGAIVGALLGCELNFLACLLVLIEGVEVSHVQVHLLVDVINTTESNRVGTYNE